MPWHHCCYGLCKSDARYKHREHMEGVFFIPFAKPKQDIHKCKRWVQACGRQDFSVENITRNTYICSKHFVGGKGPTPEHPDPLSQSQSRNSKCRPAPRDRVFPQNNDIVITDDEEDTVTPVLEIGHMDPLIDHDYWKPTTSEMGVQTELKMADMKFFDDNMFQDRAHLTRKLTMDTITTNDKTCKFYTGLTISMLMLVFGWLENKAGRMTYWRGPSESKHNKEKKNTSRTKGPNRMLSLFEEFVLTMVRLRRGMDTGLVSYMFGVSKTHVSRIFKTWIELMYFELGFLIKWPTKLQVKLNLPKCFKYFPKTRAVIDCTEFFLQRPSIPSSQRVTWSSYKHRNTLKCLVAVSPRGSFTFVSKSWSGSISDRKLVQKCGFLDFLSENDDVMADRGFLIRDLLAVRKATLNIPPFSHGRQLSSLAVTKTRRIANARIHVERAIGRMKEFKLLQGVLPLTLKPYIDRCIFVIAALCNLDSSLVK